MEPALAIDVHEKPKAIFANNRVAFRANDRVIFRNYYQTHRIVVTPLRPEVARLVIIGKPLPAGIVRVGVPQDLVVQLAPAPAGYRYLIVGNRVVILDDRGYVSDILVDVFEVRP